MPRNRGNTQRSGNRTYPGFQPPRHRICIRLPDRMLIDFKSSVARIIDVLEEHGKAEEAIAEEAKQNLSEIVQDMGLAGAAIRNVVDRMAVSISVERKQLLENVTASLGDIEFSLF